MIDSVDYKLHKEMHKLLIKIWNFKIYKWENKYNYYYKLKQKKLLKINNYYDKYKSLQKIKSN